MTDEPIPISALQHWSYCPRQCALIHMEQVFEENVHTMRGRAAHARVDEPDVEVTPGARIERALPVWSERLGLVGRCDVVEFWTDGTVYPVEYKHGPRRKRDHDDIQLAAQAACLEEMLGRSIPRGAIFHVSSRRRREVVLDAPLRARMEEAARAVRALFDSRRMPPPANDARCVECSLRDACQPEMVAERDRLRVLADTLYQPEALPAEEEASPATRAARR